MKNTIILIFFAIALLWSCHQEKKREATAEPNPLSGLWMLHIMEQKDPETGTWKEWGGGAQGYLLYDDSGNMALHMTTKGYQDTDLRFSNFDPSIPVEALQHLAKSYAYFARYTVSEESSIVEHARISHSNPGEWNKVVKRRYTFSGDTLILEPVEPRLSDLRIKWIKSP